MKLLRWCCVVACALALGATRADAQDALVVDAGFKATSWTTGDGLASNYINAITQDPQGYLWLGTTAGLVRFDGVRFTHWPRGIGGADRDLPVGALLTRRDGTVWLGGPNGVSRLSDAGGAEDAARDPARATPVSVRLLLEDRDRTLWAAANNGLWRLRAGEWQQAALVGTTEPEVIYGVFEDSRGNLWVATEHAGVFTGPSGGSTFQPVVAPSDVRGFTEDAGGAIWVTTHDREVIPVAGAARPLNARQNGSSVNGWRLLKDHHGNLWVATLGSGLLRFPRDVFEREGAPQRFSVGNALTNDVVWSLYEDREGNLWAGTQRGLTRLSPTAMRGVPGATTLSQPVKAVTTTTDGAVWVGTNDGLFRIMGTNVTRYDTRDGLPNAGIYALAGDGDGSLWIGTEDGIGHFAGGRFTVVPLSIRRLRVTALAIDRRGRLWVGTRGQGVLVWANGGWSPVKSTSRAAITAMTAARDGTWIGFEDGRVERHGDAAGPFAVTGARRDNDRVAAIYEDAGQRVWVTSRTGVSVVQQDQLVAVAAGGSFSNVTAVTADDNGLLWLGTPGGVLRTSADDLVKTRGGTTAPLSFVSFDASDGLPGAPILLGQPAATADRHGHVWFVTSNGPARLDSRFEESLAPPPPVVIERVTSDERNLDPRDGLQLGPRTSRLEIRYTALHLTAPTKLRFRYRMKGFDTDWVEAGSRREAFYTNLPPGSYQFEVAAQANGLWTSSTNDVWQFSILPAFYQTWSFYGACAALAAIAVASGWKLRVRNLNRQFTAVLAERARVGREIHDTLLQSLFGVALQVDDLASRVRPDPDAAIDQCVRLRRQLEMHIRETRQSIWDLRSPILAGRDLPTALREAAESIAEHTRIALEFAVAGTVRRTSRYVEEQLLRVGLEALTNAIRHGSPTRVRIDVIYDSASIGVRVADNGCGFDPAAPTNTLAEHWGIVGMHERAQQIRAQLHVESQPGKGTQVEIIAPRAAADLPRTTEAV